MLPRFRSGAPSDRLEPDVPLAGQAAHDQHQAARFHRRGEARFRGADSPARRTRGHGNCAATAPERLMPRNAPAVADGRRRHRENEPHPRPGRSPPAAAGGAAPASTGRPAASSPRRR